MKGKLSMLYLLGMIGAVAAESPDLLRFTNGDQLHGAFQGLKDGPQVIWKRDDLAAPVDFKSAQLRHVVLQGGRASKGLTSLSNVSLVSGDKVPGVITGLDAESVTLDTSYAGVIKIPRDHVSMLAPSPLGGRIHYHGPFVENEWQMHHAAFRDGLPPVAAAAAGADDEDSDAPGRWRFAGSAWYWQNKTSGTALVCKEIVPQRAVIRFDVGWKNRLSFAIAFNADFARVKPVSREGEEDADGAKRLRFVPGDSTVLPILFGNSYVLHVFANHLMLYRTAVDADGVASIDRVQVNSNSIRLGDSGNATFEIRSNRITNQISLFIDGEFAAQWSEGSDREEGEPARPGDGGKATGLGFVVQAENSAVRISDIMVAEWNGMPDSARSLQVDDQDIVLLANGTDRFSGNIQFLKDGKIGLTSKHGNFQFPLDEIAEIRFAKNRLSKVEDPAVDNVVVRFSPLGQIAGRPLSGDLKTLRMLHPVIGEMNVQLESAVMLDFQPSNNLIDDWNSEF